MELDPSSQLRTVQQIIKGNWPKILNWIRYFALEITTGKPGLEAIGMNVDAARYIEALTRVIAAVFHCDDQLFNTAGVNSHDGLFNIIVKLWWISEKYPNIAPYVSRQAYALFYTGISRIPRRGHDEPNPSTNAYIPEAVLQAIGGDAAGLATRVIGYLDDPPHNERTLIAFSLLISLRLITDPNDESSEALTKFMIAFFKNDLVHQVTRVLKSLLTESEGRKLNLPENHGPFCDSGLRRDSEA